jgi:hypothetical protein
MIDFYRNMPILWRLLAQLEEGLFGPAFSGVPEVATKTRQQALLAAKEYFLPPFNIYFFD